ncbi:MAG: hypothetical protein IRZ07_29375 [Microbispora sp.]|nr:hypothetical protein [Microbispora sp.]
MAETMQHRWRINPETLTLDPVDGEHPKTFTAQECRVQQWPPCPVCDSTIEVDFVDVRTSQDPAPVYVMGTWRRPNDCDPHPVLQRP